MDLESLLGFYAQDKRTQSVAGSLQGNSPTRLHLKGLVGSSDSFAAAAVFKQTEYNHLFILPDKEDASYFQSSLRSLLTNKDVFFFPDSFKKPGIFDQISNTDILLRAETVNRVSNRYTKGELIVSYSEAFFERVVSKQALEKNTIHMKVGEKLDIDFIIELLVTYEFERVDFVYEPGQFSIRGGIVDIFSFGNELPYRVELFGEEVESIRVFEPTTQLSTKKISQVTIVPNIQTHFKREEKVSFFEVLPENTIVWLKNLQFTKERLEKCFENAVTMYQADNRRKEYLTEQEREFFAEEPIKTFETVKNFLQDLSRFSCIEFGNTAFLKPQHTVEYNIAPQPVFNKNFELLISNLKDNQRERYTNYIFSDNAKQVERFYHIFEDMKAEVQFTPILVAIHEGFVDHDLKLACYTDHQIFERYHKYNTRKGFSKDAAMVLKALKELQPGDFVTHIDYGVGVYSGLEKIEVNGQMQEAVRLRYRDNDLLYVSINALHKISKYVGKEGQAPKVNKLGTDAWEQVKRKTKKKIKDIAEELIKLYAQRKAHKGFAFSPDTYIQNELEASFIYEDTPDQIKATADFKRDMEKSYPMDRLVCGDVGFGKTEIAIRAAAKAVADSKQVAVLAPTTILTLQHSKTFKNRLKDFPMRVEFLNRIKSAAEKKAILKDLKEGKIDILVGTHALLSKDVAFKDLGLLIIDEEQKFGVAAKEKLRELRVNVDTLTLTATPIPRTLQFSLLGARDLSIMNTPPPNRQPIQTEVHTYNDEIVKEAIYYEIARGGQVFFVHNRVKDILEIAGMLKRLCPEVDFGVAHGQMDGHKLEEAMMRFEDREYDVLVCTNIVEAGLDIPNANTIIINNAHHFGLSDLHQLRGRVGRSNKKAFCYLFTPPLSSLSSDTRRRLQTIEEFAELGSGFNIAMRDLDIRGAGNLLGGEQSGFIAEIGYDMYHKILDETIRELKKNQFKELYKDELEGDHEFIKDVQVDTDLEMLIPDDYVRNINERLSLYTELNNIAEEEKLQSFKYSLIDRFGPLPVQVNELFHAIRIQWVAKRLGFERIVIKHRQMKCYFVEDQQSYYYESPTFAAILKHVQERPKQFSLKQTPKHLILTVHHVASMSDANKQLFEMQKGLEG
ncbi:MAG: transcription-repair coupling factor [Chitinophagales bacterium]|nr:transcription-repair coupling factor [Chitinophagales bacterium]